MAKKSTRKHDVKNAGPAMGCGPITQTDGIRSMAGAEPWNKTLTTNPTRQRNRVKTARALDEELPFIGYLNTSLPEEALGNGMVISSLSENKDFRKKATALFDLWGSSNKIDVQGNVNIYSCQAMLGHYKLRDGEIFALQVASKDPDHHKRKLQDKSFRALQLQFLRRDQIGNVGPGKPPPSKLSSYTRWDDGILLDDLDRPVVYRILLRKKEGSTQPAGYYDVPASQMIHIKIPSLEGSHGQPAAFRGQKCALDLIDLRALSKYSDKIRAAFLGVIKTESGETPMSMKNNVKAGKKPDPEDSTKTVEDKTIRYYEIAGGVQIPVLKKDEEITFFTGQSTLTFGEQISMIYKEICFAYMIAPEYAWELFKLGSASVRLTLRKITKALDRIRRPFREVFLQQVWEMVISDAIAKKLLPNVEDWNVIQCKAGPDPTIDAGRDENSEREKLLNFTGTVAEYCDATQRDGTQVRHERLDEIADNIDYGASLKLPWFLCVDVKILQAAAAIVSNPNLDLGLLADKLNSIPDSDSGSQHSGTAAK